MYIEEVRVVGLKVDLLLATYKMQKLNCENFKYHI